MPEDSDLDRALEGRGPGAAALAPSDGARPATARGLAIVGDLLGCLFGKAGERLAALERRVAELERQPFRYVGVWDPARGYAAAEIVTDHGSMFYCRRETHARPGQSDDWVLCCKRGRDGKDRHVEDEDHAGRNG